jgi:hypothetical protein
MTDDDLSIEEKRVFSSKAGKTEVFVAADVGVVVVDVSADHVGGFGIDHRCTARGVAGRDGRIAVATDEDVLLAPGYEATGFGAAVGVGLTDDHLVAVADDGRVATLAFDTVLDADRTQWRTVGHVAEPRGVDGRLVASGDGVFRIVGDDLRPAGLTDVHDVASGGPFAATEAGLFYLGNGWMEVEGGSWTVVDAAVPTTGAERRAHAVGEAGVRRLGSDGDWQPADLPLDGAPVGFAYGDDVVCTVTDEGTFLVDAGDGARTQALGLGVVEGVAIP